MKTEVGQKITCPYCGKPGKVLRIDGDALQIEHKSGKRKLISGGSGLLVEVNAFMDGCTPNGKIGSDNHTQRIEVVEEDF